MDHLALVYFMLFLAAVYPMTVILLYPILYISWMMYSSTRGQDKIMENVKKKGQMVMAEYVHQHRMHHKPASGNDVETVYSYEYMGKKYKYTMYTNVINVPSQLPLYFYKNPGKAFAQGSVSRERVPRIRLILLSFALPLAGCVVAMIIYINSPDLMNSFKMFFEELMKKGGI